MHGHPTLIIALTATGAALGRTLAASLEGRLALPSRLAPTADELSFDSLPDFIARHFHQHDALVFLSAAGIAVRVLAPHIRDKSSDPAVVVLDQLGRHVISLLSGHLGGANDLARKVADITGGQAVITTATDTEGLPSADLLAYESGLNMETPRAVKHVNAAILEGETILVWDPLGRLRPGLAGCTAPDLFRHVESPADWSRDAPSILVDWRDPAPVQPGARTLILRPPVLAVGVGCRFGTFSQDILLLVEKAFRQGRLALQSIGTLVSVTDKLNEPGLNDAARRLGVPYRCYPPDDLNQVDVPNPSEAPLRHLGTRSVCEAAALLHARGGPLIIPKTKSDLATVAVAICVNKDLYAQSTGTRTWRPFTLDPPGP